MKNQSSVYQKRQIQTTNLLDMLLLPPWSNMCTLMILSDAHNTGVVMSSLYCYLSLTWARGCENDRTAR